MARSSFVVPTNIAHEVVEPDGADAVPVGAVGAEDSQEDADRVGTEEVEPGMLEDVEAVDAADDECSFVGGVTAIMLPMLSMKLVRSSII